MKKTYLALLTFCSFISILVTGCIVSEGITDKNQELIVEFISSGRVEIIHTHQGISDTVTFTGLHSIFISRNINEPWGISFSVNSLDNLPVFIKIKTLNGETVYETVVASDEGYLFMDCKTICGKTK